MRYVTQMRGNEAWLKSVRPALKSTNIAKDWRRKDLGHSTRLYVIICACDKPQIVVTSLVTDKESEIIKKRYMESHKFSPFTLDYTTLPYSSDTWISSWATPPQWYQLTPLLPFPPVYFLHAWHGIGEFLFLYIIGLHLPPWGQNVWNPLDMYPQLCRVS
jgi:hypothetical protein